MSIILLVSVLALLEFRASQGNIGTTFNGYGAIQGVLTRTSSAPMRYRVLVPWLLWAIPRRVRLQVYLAIKALLILLAILAVEPLVSSAGLLVFAIAMAATFEFDYWDCYVEVAAVAMILSGEPVMALVGATLWAFSKETVLLAPVIALFVGGPTLVMATVAGVVVWGLVHIRQGKAGLYYERWGGRVIRLRAWRGQANRPPLLLYWIGIVSILASGVYNASDLKQMMKRRDTGMMMSLLWTVAIVIVALSTWGTPLAQTSWLALVWVLAAWTMVRARETRIMLPSAIWVAMAFS